MLFFSEILVKKMMISANFGELECSYGEIERGIGFYGENWPWKLFIRTIFH